LPKMARTARATKEAAATDGKTVMLPKLLMHLPKLQMATKSEQTVQSDHGSAAQLMQMVEATVMTMVD